MLFQDLAHELQLRGWDAGRTIITTFELRERCVSDYELIVLARVLSVQLDDLTKGTYEESLRMAQTTGKESQLRLKSSVHAISAVNLTQGSFFSEAVRAIRWQRGEIYPTLFPLVGDGGPPGR